MGDAARCRYAPRSHHGPMNGSLSTTAGPKRPQNAAERRNPPFRDHFQAGGLRRSESERYRRGAATTLEACPSPPATPH